MSRRAAIFSQLLSDCGFEAVKPVGEAFAPSNIALAKYWGKRDTDLFLPMNDSVSVSLGDLGTNTRVTVIDAAEDVVILNGQPVSGDKFYRRLIAYLDDIRTVFGVQQAFHIETDSTIPIAAGLASSASGFAALVLALRDLMGWELSDQQLSMLCRLGSGSASRSLWPGFVHWQAGSREDGMDSFAHPVEPVWDDLQIGLLMLHAGQKPVGSTAGMARTVETSSLYQAWPEQSARDVTEILAAIETHDFERLGQYAERSAMAMHATMLSAWPPILYSVPETVGMMHQVWEMRASGVPVYMTQDAGPNLKLLFLKSDTAAVINTFPSIIQVF